MFLIHASSICQVLLEPYYCCFMYRKYYHPVRLLILYSFHKDHNQPRISGFPSTAAELIFSYPVLFSIFYEPRGVFLIFSWLSSIPLFNICQVLYYTVGIGILQFYTRHLVHIYTYLVRGTYVPGTAVVYVVLPWYRTTYGIYYQVLIFLYECDRRIHT